MTITDISPASGTQRGGTAVTITGTGFPVGCTVTFDGVPATSVIRVDSSHITCVSPKHDVGPVTVVVMEP